MREYIKENITLHPTNPAIKIYNSYTWVSGVSPAGEIYIIKNDGLYYEDVRIVEDTSTHNNYSKVGEVIYFYGLTPPDGWLACDGSTYNVADYPALAAALGYSSSDVTFNVPDFRQCTLKGANTTDGAGVITKAGIPSHTHNIQGVHSHPFTVTNHTHKSAMQRNGNSNCGTGGSDYLNSRNSDYPTDVLRTDLNSGGTTSRYTLYAVPTVDVGNIDDSAQHNVTRSYQCGVNILIRAI